MKVNDILTINIDDKAEVHKLVYKYLKIDYVDKNIGNHKKVFEMYDYEDFTTIQKIGMYVAEKMKFNRCALLVNPDQVTSNIIDLTNDKIYTIYAKTLKEHYIKLATFCYYMRHSKKL